MGTKSAPDRLYRKEAAALLGVAPVTLLEMERRGDGPPVMRIGPRMVRYDRDELETWMRAKGIKAVVANFSHEAASERRNAADEVVS